MHTQNPSAALTEDTTQAEKRNRYVPLATNFSTSPSLFIDTQAAPRDLQECASIRIQAATDLLESMTCMSITNVCDQDLRRVVNVAFLLLRDGVDLMRLLNTTRATAAAKSTTDVSATRFI
ncbi:hypothetical protein [Pseudomonas syringae]|uniref:hypothetical protein n=1 Tax=Pseudomonas syringae TaxID=317 RepID=UPI000691A1FC|nr:hypothetical protein [Pseudomonas syringae]